MNKNKERMFLYLQILLIAGIAFAFRYVGLSFGIPDSERFYSYHPDEFLTVETALQKVIKQGTLEVGFYNYPSLYIFISSLFIMFGMAYGDAGTLGDAYYLAKLASAVIGTLAVIAVFFAGKAFWGKRAGLFAAFVLALAPLHIIHSHFATVDVPSTLFISLVLICCAYIAKESKWKFIIWAGVFSGLAMGTKYNAVLVFLSVAASIILTESKDSIKTKIIKIITSGLLAVLVFLLSTPGAFLNTSAFMNGILYEAAHQSQGHSNVFLGMGNPYFFNISFNLFRGIGAINTIIALLAIIYGIYKKDKTVWILLAFLLPYYLLMSASKVNFARYLIPIYPVIALMVGYGLNILFREFFNIQINRMMVITCFAIFAVQLVVSSANSLDYFKKVPTQDRATEYIEKTLDKSDDIGIMDIPWFYSPVYSSRSGYGALGDRVNEIPKSKFKLEIIDSKTSDLPKYFVVSDYEFYDAARIKFGKKTGNYIKDLTGSAKKNLDGGGEILDTLKQVKNNYTCVKSFSNGNFINLKNAPHDMCYINPVIYVFKRNY